MLLLLIQIAMGAFTPRMHLKELYAVLREVTFRTFVFALMLSLVVAPMPHASAAKSFSDICGPALETLSRAKDALAREEQASGLGRAVGEFFNDHYQQFFQYGLVTGTVLGGSYLLYRMGRRHPNILRQRYLQIQAAKSQPEFIRYENSVKELKDSIHAIEKSLNAMPEEQFNHWAKLQDPVYVKRLRAQRALGKFEGDTEGVRFDSDRKTEDGKPYVSEAHLERLEETAKSQLTQIDKRGEELFEAFKRIGFERNRGFVQKGKEVLLSSNVNSPDPIASEGFNEGGRLRHEKLAKLLQRAERFSDSLHKEEKGIVDDLNGAINPDGSETHAGQNFADWLKRQTIPHDLKPGDAPVELPISWIPMIQRLTQKSSVELPQLPFHITRKMVNLSRVAARTGKSQRYWVVYLGTPFGIWFLQKGFNQLAQAEREEEETNQIIESSEEQANREEEASVPKEAIELAFMAQGQWFENAEQFGEAFNYPFPWKGGDDLLELKKALIESKAEVAELKKKNPERYKERGRQDVDEYRVFWNRVFKMAQNKGAIPNDEPTNTKLFGKDGTGRQGMVDTFARQSAEGGRQQSDATLKSLTEYLAE